MKIQLPKHFYRISPAALALSTILIFIVIGLAMHIQVLSSRLQSLEGQTASLTTELATYERTQCSNAQSITTEADVTRFTRTSAGYERTYQVKTPEQYDPSIRYPVIISFDGIEGSGSRMQAYSGLDSLPAVIVYPDSLPGKFGFTAWQGAPYSVEEGRDIQFVRDILSDVPQNYCIDTARTYAVGMSNGGAFANIVGCKLGDQIQAVASMSGAYYTDCEPEERTPSLLVLHSIDDRQVPFAGEQNRHLPQIPGWVEAQVKLRECDLESPAQTDGGVAQYTWKECADNSIVRMVVIRDQAHGWLAIPSVSEQGTQNSAGYIWKFFKESTFYN